MNRCVYIVFLLVIVACQRENKLCLKGAGNLTTQTIELSAFNNLRIYDDFNVELVSSNENKMEVRCGENLLKTVISSYSGDTLIIESGANCDWFRRADRRDVSITLYTDGFRHLSFYGSGNVQSIDTLTGSFIGVDCWDAGGNIDLLVKTDSISLLSHTGPCDITSRGLSDYAYLYSAGNGAIDIQSIEVDEVYVNHAGTNDFYVNAINILEVEIQSIGNVRYTGNPSIVLQKHGTGNLISL